jgi:uroporphyrinogen-III synthase
VEIPTYRWSLPKDLAPLESMIDALGRGEIDAVVITNAAQVHNLFQLAERRGRAAALRASLNRVLIASIGPVASAALAGFQVDVGLEASPPKLGPLVAALDDALDAPAV